jgi:hypothetical protein
MVQRADQDCDDGHERGDLSADEPGEALITQL